jgi:hypothetical protein
MKIRITENTLRIRLSESDLKDLSAKKIIHVSLPMGDLEFAIQLQVQQSYIHEKVTSTETQIDSNPEIYFDHHTINIAYPSNMLQSWIDSREIHLKNNITYPNNRTLNLIVEKDFLG